MKENQENLGMNVPNMKNFEVHFIDSNEPLAYLKRVKFIEASEEYER